MKKAMLLFGFALIFLTRSVYAEAGFPLWTNIYLGSGSSQARSLAVDTNGNAFIAGISAPDYLFVKYSNAGVALWTNRYRSSYFSTIRIVANSTGDIFVAASSVGTGSGFDFVTIKYSNSGLPLWTNRFNGLSNNADYATTLVADYEGGVIIGGNSIGVEGGYDYAAIKYSVAGIPLWTNWYDSPTHLNDFVTSAAIDRSNNVFVAGYSIPDSNIFLSTFFTIKYSRDGLALWTNTVSRPINWRIKPVVSIAVDSIGDVVVSGYGQQANPKPYGYLVVKYSNDGIPLWTNNFSTSTNSEIAVGMATDFRGNIIVTGYSTNAASSSGSDFLTLAFAPTGMPLWTNRYTSSGANHDVPSAIAIDGDGNSFVTGASFNANLYTVLTVAYSLGGAPVWTNSYFFGVDDYFHATAIASDPEGNVFVTGGAAIYQGYATIKYAAFPARLFNEKSNDGLILSWNNPAYGLACSPGLTAGFTMIPGATSPYTNFMEAGQEFFRLISITNGP